MGYQAPSPEEVYRHALRLDGRRSLTDRFGFSIVFVNDTSPVCREFLLDYCVDLCLRTADRIRFVFFSELGARDFADIVRDLQSGRAHGGMLRSVLEFLRFGRWIDYERDPWRNLRPDAFLPLRTVEDISVRLNWECDLRTAMPGAGMAMQFAQRLGIGRHVPCILVFTEVGDLYVDLLPIAGLTAERIYKHVRGWIDEFYEQNRAVLDQWNDVENKVTSLVAKANSSLREVRDWRDARVRDWETLSTVAGLIYSAEHADFKTFKELAAELQYSMLIPGSVRELLQTKNREIEDIAAAECEAAALRQLLLHLVTAKSALDVLAALKEVYGRAQSVGDNLSRLKHCIGSLDQRLSMPQKPLDFVKLWWLEANRQKLSLKLFKAERTRWEHVFQLPRTVNFRQEFDVVRNAVESLPLNGDVATGASVVLRIYGAHLGVDVESEAWQMETENYREIVQHFLRRLCSTAPEWLRQRQPALTIGETFPWPQELDQSSTEEILRDRSPLRLALEDAMSAAPTAVRDDISRTEALAASYRDEFRTELEARVTRLDVSNERREEFLANALAELRPVRRRLEFAALSASTQELTGTSRWDEGLAIDLHRTLDTYSDVARSIRYPHRNDPLLRRVPIDVPLAIAAGIETEDSPRELELRGSLEEVAAAARSAPRLISEASVIAVEARPSTRLAAALSISLNKKRLQEVLAPFRGETLRARVEAAVADHRAADLLRNLSRQEQEAIARELTGANGAIIAAPTAPAAQAVDIILTALGLYTGSTEEVTDDPAKRAVREKTLADDFDVFMAHNSKDKPAILEIGRKLRDAGIYPWIDVEQIPPGRWFQDVIQAVIPRVRAAAIFISREGLGRWQSLELRSFITQCVERGLPVIPVLLPGAADIPQEALFLRELNFVRFVGGLDDEQALGRLVWGITGEKPALHG